MTYQEEYTSLIEHAKSTTPQHKGYGIERHHIVPRCMGGTDDESNLVFLTYEQHINAHILLWKAHPTNGKLAGAVCAMLDLTGTTSKSASARVKFLESLSRKERDVFISEATEARAEKYLPWNTSGFGRTIELRVGWLHLHDIKTVYEAASKMTTGFVKTNAVMVELGVRNFIGDCNVGGWANRFDVDSREFMQSDVIGRYDSYGRKLIIESIIRIGLSTIHTNNALRVSVDHTRTMHMIELVHDMYYSGDCYGIIQTIKQHKHRRPNNISDREYPYHKLVCEIEFGLSVLISELGYDLKFKHFIKSNKRLSCLLRYMDLLHGGGLTKNKPMSFMASDFPDHDRPTRVSVHRWLYRSNCHDELSALIPKYRKLFDLLILLNTHHQ